LCFYYVNIYELRFKLKTETKEIALSRDISNEKGHINTKVKLRRVRVTIVAVEK